MYREIENEVNESFWEDWGNRGTEVDQGKHCRLRGRSRADHGAGLRRSRLEGFPRALIVAGGKLTCDNIEDRITEVKGLLDYMVK